MPKITSKKKSKKPAEGSDSINSEMEAVGLKSDSKNDSLTLNDNINYHLYYESSGSPKGDSSMDSNSVRQKETSLSSGSSMEPKTYTKHYKKNRASAFLNRNFNKPVGHDNSFESDEPRYQRFSQNRRCSSWMPSVSSIATGLLISALFCILGAATWWIVTSALNDTWSEEHYRRLWLAAHPSIPQTPDSYYHDHNNLSVKNRVNASENAKIRKLEKNKSTFTTLTPIKVAESCDKMADADKIDCYPQYGASAEKCQARGCCWVDPSSPSENVPYCYYPSNFRTYKLLNASNTKHKGVFYYTKIMDSTYPDDFSDLKVEVFFLSRTAFQVKMSDPHNTRFEPPYPEVMIVPSSIDDYNFELIHESDNGGFKIVRKDDETVLFDCSNIEGMIYSDKFLQYTLHLPTKYVYGLGERRGKFLLDFNWQTRSIFNYDNVPGENVNGYGSHPFYLAMEESGKSHGVLLLNSNAMDVTLTPKPALTYRTIGGILNFFVFTGPSPSEVIAEYSSVIGLPFMPPYWSLGFHLCKYEYGSLKVTEEVWNRTRSAGIPFDVQWNDIDYMKDRNDFTYDKVKFAGLPNFVKRLHEIGMHYVPIFDPGVAACEPKGTYKPYDLGLKYDIFVKNRTGFPFVGEVWNKCGETVFPDFTHSKINDYWVELFQDLHMNFQYDGAWIDMNEPSNFLNGPKHGACLDENLPYTPKVEGGDGLKTKTLCMDALHSAGTHFNLHNLYALYEAMVTNFALKEVRGKRPFIISRASFVGLGHFAGHWTGDISSNWHDMRMSIPDLLNFNLFGIPMVGADICGFHGDASAELCKRWSQLGAFYPFSRNHNCDTCKPQDPVILGEEVTRAAREFLRVRYSLLPYLYGLFERANREGATVVRPVFFEYPEDKNTYALDEQFLWGSHVMIAPILYEGVTTTKAYIPEDYWYVLNGTRPLDPNKNGWTVLNEDEVVLVRGGVVIPMHKLPQSGPITTTALRSLPFHLLAALDSNSAASGSLYWDDGDSLNSYEEKKYSNISFVVANNQLSSNTTFWGHGVPVLEKISLMGVKFAPTRVYVNGKVINHKYDGKIQKLTIDKLSIPLQYHFTVEWQ